MQLGIEDIVGDVAESKHAAEQLRDFHRSGTYKHRAPLIHHSLDFVNDSGIFLLLGLVDTVIHVVTGYRTVGRDCDNIKFIDVPKLTGFCFSRTGHTGQLVVHAEVVLEGYGRKCLCSSLNLHTFLGLDGLMQAVTIASAFHDTASLFIDDFDFVVIDDILHIFFKQGVGL